MRYSDFINQTLLQNNNIDWNYYHQYVRTTDLFQGPGAREFIKDYFKNGEKIFSLFINPDTIPDSFKCYIIETSAKTNFDYSDQFQLPNDRAIHTVSGFFLGLLIENSINNSQTLSLECLKPYPFSYLWFLTFLYHDYGYCVTERENPPVQFPIFAPIPNDTNHRRNGVSVKDYRALSQIKRSLKINISPFSSYQISIFDQNRPHSIGRSLLRELTQKNNTIQGYPKLRFRGGPTINGVRYRSAVITMYMNYCINELKHVDHGIIGGYLFYDRTLKNYARAYMSAASKENSNIDLSNFIFKNRHFSSEQLKIFSYISDCILAHNIWKQPDNKRHLYEQYQLNDLFVENFKIITYEDNPLLYILVVTDSIEPTKIYQKSNPTLSVQQIINAIEIEYQPGLRALTFSSNSDIIDIGILYGKAKGLESWTSARCSNIQNGKFTLTI